MVLLCGIPSESPLARVNHELLAMGEQSVLLSQRLLSETAIEWRIKNGKPEGQLHLGGTTYGLEKFKGMYSRLMGEASLPELAGKPDTDEAKKHAASLHQSLSAWIDVAPGRVVNRLSAMMSNGSKPYQAQLIRRHGLEIPPTLITNNPDEVRRFKQLHKTIIYKSISGVRSIVKEFAEADEERLELIRWCPVQFQAKIEGYDVRVHVVGKTAIATKICSTVTDYRYAAQEGGEAELEPFALPELIEKRCVQLSESLGLAFSGIDLMFATDGKVYCFEVNPMPGYSYFEANSGQPIAKTLAYYLSGN